MAIPKKEKILKTISKKRTIKIFKLGKKEGKVGVLVKSGKTRKKVREDLGIKDNEILILHSGKMNESKKTLELLKSFLKTKSSNLKLILLGSIGEGIKPEMLSLISSDNRINFLGWKNVDEMYDFLCATDLYAQPGSQSATLQNAICTGCPVMVFPYKSHEPYVKANGFYVKNQIDISEVIKLVDKNPEILNEMQTNSRKIAKELLDYNELSRRITIKNTTDCNLNDGL